MNVDSMEFPVSKALHDGFWQPIFFRPNLDSPEQLVVGILTQVSGTWSLVRANALSRLKCLYGQESSVAIEAITLGLIEFDRLLQERGEPSDPSEIVSGLSLGAQSVAEARNAAELAAKWLRTASSLHDARKEYSVELPVEAANQSDPIARDISKDRLPVLVMGYMADRAPQTKAMFNSHIRRLEIDESARLLTHKAFVAFEGKRVAANFATLKPGRQKIAVDISKRLMWDLEQHRDAEKSLLPRQAHEMILYHPSKDDPTISERQFDNVMEVVRTLEQEGKNREIDVRPYVNVRKIAEHILKVEELA